VPVPEFQPSRLVIGSASGSGLSAFVDFPILKQRLHVVARGQSGLGFKFGEQFRGGIPPAAFAGEVIPNERRQVVHFPTMLAAVLPALLVTRAGEHEFGELTVVQFQIAHDSGIKSLAHEVEIIRTKQIRVLQADLVDAAAQIIEAPTFS